MEQKRVVVLYGGQSTEHEISRRSAKFVIQNADRSKYEIIPVGIDKTGKWCLQNLESLLKCQTEMLHWKIRCRGFSFQLVSISREGPWSDSRVPILHGPTEKTGLPKAFRAQGYGLCRTIRFRFGDCYG